MIKSTKKCSKCGEVQDIDMFSKANAHKDGHKGQCKVCVKEYYKNNKDKIKEQKKEYNKNNKDRIKERQKKYYENNKDRIKEYDKEYRENNKDRIKEYRETHRIEYKAYVHKRRARIKSNGGSYTKAQWLECLEFFDYKCAYSGEPLTVDTASVEHVVPVSKGGTSDISNLVPCVLTYNISKNDTDLIDWYSRQVFFSIDRLAKIYKWIEYVEQQTA